MLPLPSVGPCCGPRKAANTLAKVIQVEISTPTARGTLHTVTWVDADIRPKEGMVLSCKGDARPWRVVKAYSIAQEMADINTGWKVGEL